MAVNVCTKKNADEYGLSHHPTRACGRGLDFMIVSSLCLIHSESLHGFCHFHLNCTSHWWWLLFHLQSLPACPTAASFFIDNCPIGTICSHNHLYLIKKEGSKLTIHKAACGTGVTFRVWSINVADSLTDPLTIPGVNFSCFGAGRDTGDKGPLISSAKCFNEVREFPCWFRSYIKSVKMIPKTG